MIGASIGGRPWVAALLVGLGSGFAVAWAWQANAYRAQLASQAAAFQADLTTIANASAAQARKAFQVQQRMQQALTDLDRKYTQEKEQANAENEALRRAVADGTRRLRIAGTCPAGTGHVPDATGTAGVGDAGTVELAQVAGRAVFDIRAGIIADQAALKALQEYVREVCM
ncbi:lysis protein [Pseudomonas sp. 21LCFQ010]|uniref:lysis protein n=1 Tax=Pseudomonas sp. 21LCFQ010 TaxID=2957506 RepID=UPI002097A34B|nr:lysis protein [Pseudomonas sp. 21LCFQ010]MCO8160991.1 lysis protein [Pseudomonas sp. 21LCFQ010]